MSVRRRGEQVKIDRSAGKPADPSILVNVAKLVTAYYDVQPDLADPKQRVVFGTSGHRGSAFDGAFNAWHILAITQAICDHRKAQKVDGPLFLAMDTHALSEPAFSSALTRRSRKPLLKNYRQTISTLPRLPVRRSSRLCPRRLATAIRSAELR
jgi:hypothetical protein